MATRPPRHTPGTPRPGAVFGQGPPAGTYEIVCAEPPWERLRRQAALFEQLRSLPLEAISGPDALLFLWLADDQLERGVELGRAWGFEWVTFGFAWNTLNPQPGPFSTTQVELCAIMRRGRIPRVEGRRRGSRRERQWLEGPVAVGTRKPDEALRRIAAMFPQQRRLLLFARTSEPGWDSWEPDLGGAAASPVRSPRSGLD